MPVAAIGAAIGFGGAIAANAGMATALGAAAIGGYVGSQIDQTKAAEKAVAAQEKAIGAQKEIAESKLEAEKEIAEQYVGLTEKEKRLMGQISMIQTLADVMREETPAQPVVFTTTTAKPTGILDQINQSIDNFLKGL